MELLRAAETIIREREREVERERERERLPSFLRRRCMQPGFAKNSQPSYLFVKERDAYSTNLLLNYFNCNHLCRCTHLTRGSAVVGLVYVPQGSIHEYKFEYSGMQVSGNLNRHATK